MFNIQLVGVKYSKLNQFGDFYWMCSQDEYSDVLFIFNDNEEYHETCRGGAGNAIIRKYNKYSILNKPKSAGIPTGTLQFGGYTNLNTHAKSQIDNAIKEIIELIKQYKYKQIYYSSELDGILGTSIFEVDNKVRRYITYKLYSLTKNPVKIVKLLPNVFFDDDYGTDDETVNLDDEFVNSDDELTNLNDINT
jgi:hypothetical protein